jgi:hypothetical protein
LRARRHGFGLIHIPAASALALLLTDFAALGLVLEILVVEEVLFSRCEDEVRSTVYAFEDAVLKLRHSNCSRDRPEWLSDYRDGEAFAAPPSHLLNFPAVLLPVSFTGQRLLGPELLTWLQVKRVPLDLFYNVLLLDFALEATKGVFQGFALLQLYFSQTRYTSRPDLDFPARRKPRGVKRHRSMAHPGKFPAKRIEGTDIIRLLTK